ncbi:MAG: hypothetical protein H3C50_09565 [Kiritimatiellae bacterium]|nr:hypothetical protein [Kiritimatiellia bacterium]MCO5068405.1 hypothetical protein [Kiritimatiellia bacterium]
MKRDRIIFLLILLLALFVRSAGLFRGLDAGFSFHPDAAKQVTATHNFLRGQYLWYTGSLAYDGYPYGLNHVDEWIIRAVWPAASAILHALQPSLDVPPRPSMETLYFICRALRVLYSLLAWGLFAWILHRSAIPRFQGFAWMLLAALAPVSSIVTHSAAGDVGPDLFVLLAPAFLVHARQGAPNPLLFAGSGFALGCAFACKYHGILGGLTPGLFLLLTPLPWRKRIALGIAVAIGAIVGFAALTPHVFIAPERTLELIGQNFVYIQNYGVSERFLKLPFAQRVVISLKSNTPTVFDALGFTTIGIAALALFFAARRLFRGRDSVAAFDSAVIAMPFCAMALSLIGKPAIQPFHFSFLVLPLLLGSALLWQRAEPRGLRLFLPILLALNLGEYALKQKYDLFFWLREDTIHVAQRLDSELLKPRAGARPQTIARLAVEGENRAVFRNKPTVLRLDNAAGWSDHPNDILPTTPWSAGPDWVFTDLPAFPRETRLIPIPVGRTFRRSAIAPAEQELPLTLYANSRAAEVAIEVGPSHQTISLAPFEVRQLTFAPSDGEPFAKKNTARHRYDLKLRARGAPVLLRVGPEPNETPDPSRAGQKMDIARFLDGTLEPNQPRFLQNTYLFPGLYSFELEAPSNASPFTLRITDPLLTHPDREQRIPLQWTDRVWRAEWSSDDLRFVTLSLESSDALVAPAKWHIQPRGIRTLAPHTETVSTPWSPALSFGNGAWVVGNLEIPTQIARGEPFAIRAQLATTIPARETMRQYSLFVHLLTENNKQVFAADIPLIHVPPAHSNLSLDQRLGNLDLEPGRYKVAIGLYRPLTTLRVKPDPTSAPVNGRRVIVGTLQVE